MISDLTEPMGKVASKVFDHLTNLAGHTVAGDQSSLIKVSSVARVEPITLVDMRAQSLPYTPEVMQSLNSIFAGYYLQAIALMMPVGRVNVIKTLDRLSPDRQGFLKQLEMQASVSLDSYGRLPEFKEAGLGLEAFSASAAAKKIFSKDHHKVHVTYHEDVLEENAEEKQRRDEWDANHKAGASQAEHEEELKKRKEWDSKHGAPPKESSYRVGANKDLNSVIMDSVNLSVGKLLEVTVKDGNASANIPVAIRLLATVLDPKTLVHILSDNSRNTGFKERWHGWRSGELKFWKDLILCQDLIDEHRRALMKDSSNVHSDIMARSRKNSQAALISGAPSAGNASNLAVLTAETAGELERVIGGRLRDFKTRQRIFNSTYLMILTVIDPEWEHVTFYHNGISTPTTMSVGELKSANKGTGPDVFEILKAFNSGLSPSI